MACCGEWTPDGKYFVFQSWNGIESGLPWPAPNIWAIREAHGFLHKASGVPSQLTTGPIHFLGHVLSPDGKIIFTTSTFKRGELMQYDAKNRRLVPHLSGISADGLTYSIDGAWIAYVKFPQGELWRSRADGSEALQLTARPLVAYAPQWSPDGKQIVFDGQKAGEDWQIYVVSADGGPPKILPDSAQGYDPIWSPNGASILFARLAENHSRIERMDLKDQKVYEFPGSKQMGKARWSPDGRYLVAIREEPGKLARFDFNTGKWSEWAAAKQEIDWPTWSRDGKSLYFIGFSDPGVFRLGLQERTPVKILDLKDFRFAGTLGDWFSLTPDNKPLLLRSIGGGTEIYALHWDAP
jgi:Tol biopolymer transport system component